MKREFLKGLELTDEVIEKIMAEYGKSAEQTKNELAAANTQIKSLQDAVKKFDGVDVEALKKTAADWEEKYNKDIAALKLSSAVDTALSSVGARNPKLLKGALDMSKVSLDGENLKGLTEQIEAIKKTDAYLFNEESTPSVSGAVPAGGKPKIPTVGGDPNTPVII